MYSRILDQQTLGQVVAAAPDVGGRPADIAAEVLQVLERESMDPKAATRMMRNGETFYSMSLMDLSADLASRPTPKMAGMVLSDMGLSKRRLHDGYYVFWNEAQLDILRQAPGLLQGNVRYRVTVSGIEALAEVGDE